MTTPDQTVELAEAKWERFAAKLAGRRISTKDAFAQGYVDGFQAGMDLVFEKIEEQRRD